MIGLAGDRMVLTETADGRVTITFDDVGTGRVCGDCQLCCKLLPVTSLHKPANTRCEHQRHGKGCMIYPDRPMACKTWACRWLADRDTAGIPRPDRCHYVIDLHVDYVQVEQDGQVLRVPAIQVWVDPAFPAAHKAPELRAYLARIAERHRAVAIIRLGSHAGFVLVAPSISDTGGWLEVTDTMVHRETMDSRLTAGGAG